MNKLPPHIENEIRKNPTAVLTSRGLVKPNAGGIDEVLIGIPNAAELYGEHFNLIREQDVNREVIQPKDKTDEGTDSNDTPSDSEAENNASAEGQTADSETEHSEPEGQSTESQPESTADQSPQDEAKEAESPAAGAVADESKEELQEKPESVELTTEEKEAARRKVLSDNAKARHAAKKAAEAEAKKAAE